MFLDEVDALAWQDILDFASQVGYYHESRQQKGFSRKVAGRDAALVARAHSRQ